VATNRSPESPDVHQFRMDDDVDDRLDAYLADRFRLSRSRVAELIEQGLVTVDGAAARKSRRLRRGESVEVQIPPLPLPELAPEPIPIDIVYEDEHLAVVDKPAGLVVHPGAGHRTGTLVNALLHRLGSLSSIGLPLRPGIVHRLDRDTSGLMVVARTDEAHAGLVTALAAREVRRGYVAAAWGHLQEDRVTVDRPIGRDPKHRQRMAVVEAGRPARTHVRRLESWRAADLLAVRLHTGRTHQIRVHLLSVGHPIVGDPVYGVGWERGLVGAGSRWAQEFSRRCTRMFLHAARLSFQHPTTGDDLTFTSPLPGPLLSSLEWARGGWDAARK
jgi:23S rRNA pseudouridine1911/1915/1917 synthase